ncbi:RagB/SusD family nutrient uptake outer membrane protein [Myroides guanonis]|uniref:SusD family protein n=1 Tax=Myroides guanonis TaxID=1150112 RepID=A0A1I3MRY8_9FLAO|nr:RagB/SusD family nutrient uptake outer membrane protein [Myroides guanonis]SFI99436.1 SusD family protein [Myroides guanonis]
MKKINIYISCLILAAGFSSCDEFLSEVPDNRTQVDSKEKVGELLVTAYSQTSATPFLELMSDNVFDSENLTLTKDNQLDQYSWKLEEGITQDTPTGFWDSSYAAIAAANEALDAMEKMGVSDDPEYSGLRAEALIARAFAHFELVQIWGKAYDPATAESDLGVPYVDSPERELIKLYERESVADVYAKIEADLEEGLKSVSDNYRQPKFHFNKHAAYAFATKFYLAKANWAKVLEYSDYLAANPKAFIRDYKAFKLVGTNEKFQYYSRPEHVTNLLVNTQISSYWRYGYVGGSRFFLTGKDEASIMGRALNPFKKEWLYEGASYNSNVTVVYPKLGEYFRLDDPSAGTGMPFVNYVLFSNDEVYLNRLEALVMEGRIEEAIKGLEFFLGTRTNGYNELTDKLTYAKLVELTPYVSDELTPFYSMTIEQTVVLKSILEAKRREFIQEGKRWFDIKRFDIKVIHKFAGGTEIVLEKGDLKRQLPLPLHVVSAGLIDNPRN